MEMKMSSSTAATIGTARPKAGAVGVETEVEVGSVTQAVEIASVSILSGKHESDQCKNISNTNATDTDGGTVTPTPNKPSKIGNEIENENENENGNENENENDEEENPSLQSTRFVNQECQDNRSNNSNTTNSVVCNTSTMPNNTHTQVYQQTPPEPSKTSYQASAPATASATASGRQLLLEKEHQHQIRLIETIQREKEHLQKQCSAFESNHDHLTLQNHTLKKTVLKLQSVMQHLKGKNGALHSKLSTTMTHAVQAGEEWMAAHQWYRGHIGMLEYQHGTLWNQHQYLQMQYAVLFQNTTSGSVSVSGTAEGNRIIRDTQKHTEKDQERGIDKDVATATVTDTSTSTTATTTATSDQTKSSRVHRPFLQPRTAQRKGDDDKEMISKPKSKKEFTSISTKPNMVSTTVSPSTVSNNDKDAANDIPSTGQTHIGRPSLQPKNVVIPSSDVEDDQFTATPRRIPSKETSTSPNNSNTYQKGSIPIPFVPDVASMNTTTTASTPSYYIDNRNHHVTPSPPIRGVNKTTMKEHATTTETGKSISSIPFMSHIQYPAVQQQQQYYSPYPHPYTGTMNSNPNVPNQKQMHWNSFPPPPAAPAARSNENNIGAPLPPPPPLRPVATTNVPTTSKPFHVTESQSRCIEGKRSMTTTSGRGGSRCVVQNNDRNKKRKLSIAL